MNSPQETIDKGRTNAGTSFHRVLIAADLTEMDQHLLDFSTSLLSAGHSKKVYALHIIPDFTKPKKTILDFHQRFTTGVPVDEKVRSMLKAQFEDGLKALDVSFDIEVVEGKPYQKLVHMAKVKEVGTVIAGVKRQSAGSGITAKRLARKLQCNLLLVPETASKSIKRLVVPVDFSDNSARALWLALALQKTFDTEVKIDLIHVMQLLPLSNYYNFSNNMEYRRLMRENTQREAADFMSKHQLEGENIKLRILEDEEGHTVGQIDDFAQKATDAMLIMGAKGHSALEGLFFGSVAEGLVDRLENYPLLIVR
ncbi:MAG: universal stress protein [Bacteroidota bacterium]